MFYESGVLWKFRLPRKGGSGLWSAGAAGSLPCRPDSACGPGARGSGSRGRSPSVRQPLRACGPPRPRPRRDCSPVSSPPPSASRAYLTAPPLPAGPLCVSAWAWLQVVTCQLLSLQGRGGWPWRGGSVGRSEHGGGSCCSRGAFSAMSQNEWTPWLGWKL